MSFRRSRAAATSALRIFCRGVSGFTRRWIPGCRKLRTKHWSMAFELYEQRHPTATGLIQGSVVVLRNRDASILAETGGRQFYQDRSAAYSDFNRVTKSLRQPGST